ncbi:hypothetical protein LCGC14_1544080 [marine sediment metagenome]|uniref:Uncharacterized protein n=1 Tax=marine sediment metagenome TaxID=412755 RepID=A0A0F9IS40_9ZZZZ
MEELGKIKQQKKERNLSVAKLESVDIAKLESVDIPDDIDIFSLEY